jgi:hypothetical protein
MDWHPPRPTGFTPFGKGGQGGIQRQVACVVPGVFGRGRPATFRAPWFARNHHRIPEASLTVSPATMNTPQPRWCSVLGALTAPSTQAWSTSRMNRP